MTRTAREGAHRDGGTARAALVAGTEHRAPWAIALGEGGKKEEKWQGGKMREAQRGP